MRAEIQVTICTHNPNSTAEALCLRSLSNDSIARIPHVDALL